MKKSLDPFRLAKLVGVDEPIGSLSCADENLYVGTTQGNLLQYEVDWAADSSSGAGALGASGASGGQGAASAKRVGAVRLSPKQAVEQIRVSRGFVFALADGVLSVLPGNLEAGAATVLCRDVKHFCLHTGVDDAQEGQEGSQGPLEVCVSLRKKLVLYSHNGRAFEPRQEFPTSDVALALAWHKTWICAGFKREYSLYSDRAGVPREICHLDGKFAPQIAVLPGGELLLLVQENVGLFYNLATQKPSPKNTAMWPRRLTEVGAAINYVMGSAGAQIDVFSVRDQKSCQTLVLDGNVVAMCQAPNGKALVASQNAVTCLDPVPFDIQVQGLLLQVRVSDAQDLLNASFSAEDPLRDSHLDRFHMLAGWALFSDMQFADAFRHFTYSPGFPIARLLAFWRPLLPADVSISALANSSVIDTGVPEPRDLEDFIRERLASQRSGEDSSPSKVSARVNIANPAMASFLLKQREALLCQERMPAPQRAFGVPTDLNMMLRVVDTVLLKLLVERGEGEVDSRLQRILDKGVRCGVEDCEEFLRERGRFDVLARVWKAHGMYDLVLEHWSAMLRDAGRGASGAAKRSQIVADMSDALQNASRTRDGADLLRRYIPQLLEVATPAVLSLFVGERGGASDTAAAGAALGAEDVLTLLANHDDLLLGYLESRVVNQRDVDPKHRLRLGMIYLQQVADEVKKSGSGGSKRESVLKFFEETDHLDAHGLLPKAEELGLHEERVVLHRREQEHRQALQILVEGLNDLPRAEIYCRIVMAQAALATTAAAAVAAARGSAPPRPGVALANAAAPGVCDGRKLSTMVFCSPPPPWAVPVVFKPRRGSSAAEEESEAQSHAVELPQQDGPGAFLGAALTSSGDSEQDDNQLGVSAFRRAAAGLASGGSRPLLLFLQVLLGAYAGAEVSPQKYPKVVAEYRDAALSLLGGYAGFHDLAPHDIVGLLPSDWSLESLAEYLTKCTRLFLHERRALMLEENLSSMAYLKTFDALAHERMRKVTITGDRCCPVCNRRFVDRDSVGKAFIAYPNETCVHLQCKEDLSVCPKTGQNFTDNLSVLCNALCADSSD